VEDDEDTRAAVCEMLQEEGYRVASTRNGHEAENYLHSGGRPDCILLDLSMPVMDGWTFTSSLQQLGGRPIPIVVATAAESYWRYPVPVAHVMRKPLHEETLLPLLRKVMPDLQSRGGAPPPSPRRGRGRPRDGTEHGDRRSPTKRLGQQDSGYGRRGVQHRVPRSRALPYTPMGTTCARSVWASRGGD
jgi:CheY-like chemotaxis protein